MDSSVEGECGKLCLDERIELIHALSMKKPDEAYKRLQSWSRREILEMLRATGNERKYSSLTKPKLIENLLDLLSGRRNSEGKQKTDGSESVCCKNSACRAVLGWEGEFCKRCSCCVCLKYDDNKAPSLWLTCGSELLSEGEGCGLSCHLECALEHENSGIGRDGDRGRLDGGFYCVSCGKENDLISWRKQMTVAKETRRVDILSYRVYLGQKLLRGTIKYRELSSFMDEAMMKLEVDVGPLPLKMAARGIVNRLSSGPCVQELCSSALASLDKMLSHSAQDRVGIRVEDVQTRSITFSLDCDDSSSSPQTAIRGFRLFCRKSTDQRYLTQPTCVAYLPDIKATITGLDPATEFSLKAVAFNAGGAIGASELQFSTLGEGDEASDLKISERSQSPLTNSSGLSNPSSVDDELNNIAVGRSGKMGESDLEEGGLLVGQFKNTKRHDKRVQAEGDLPVTPRKTDTQGKKKRTKRFKSDTETGPTMTEECAKRSTTTKTKGYTDNRVYNANGVPDKDFEHIVKTIRCLEQEGHIDKSFTERFLAWYGLRATHRGVRTVKLFVETFKEDLASLGEQLVDTFSECIVSNRSTAVVPAGICLKLWH
ncbi:PREDICTED: protein VERNALIZATION INSENSITIVE 3 isoform X2 [Tarenaya hassleriana]|uniref:protein VERNALIZATION INSENSITIVE 3 isoform X2 n=1 Tax=Tarenaya hassleriana TaxID=28532 RepID=UPI00053C58B8|nr:PREDICTED: protein VERNALIZATION INSENSITIVE 3 isoform X2 [Tarenaya hassleriana]